MRRSRVLAWPTSSRLDCRQRRVCRHYTVPERWVLGGLQEGRGMVDDDAPNGSVVLSLMLRLAKLEGACPSKEPFELK